MKKKEVKPECKTSLADWHAAALRAGCPGFAELRTISAHTDKYFNWLPRQCSQLSGMEQEKNSAELCSGRVFGCDINKPPGYEKDKATVKLVGDFCLVNRNGRDMEGQKKKLPFLSCLEKQERSPSGFQLSVWSGSMFERRRNRVIERWKEMAGFSSS